MPVTGTTTHTAGANGVTYRIHTLVSPAITEDMLVSCNDLIELEIIPRNFPNIRIQNCRSIKEFKEILIRDKLNPEPMKMEKPMHITLLPGATLKKILSARRVPLRYKKEANKTIKELVERGVITPGQRNIGLVQCSILRAQGRQNTGQTGHRLHGAKLARKQPNTPLVIFGKKGSGSSSTPEFSHPLWALCSFR